MSLRGLGQDLHNEARRAEFDGMGWDGTECQMDPSTLYFVGILLRYIPTYTCNKKMSPTILWVLKFDVKLGVGDQNFKIVPGT